MADAGKATVRAAIAPLNAEPRIASEQSSQLLRGQSFTIADERGEWLHVTAEDGYKGWLNRGYTIASVGEECTHLSLACVIAHGSETLALPFGALLFASDKVLNGDAVPLRERQARFPSNASAITQTASHFFGGTPYQWGGVTPWGADCSGFLQNLFHAHSIQLPRDSGDQARSGNASDSTPRENQAGELLFFSEREDDRITHVGLALGGSRMAHVALGRGGFAVEDFSAGDADPYAAALLGRFQFARKMI